LAVYTLIQN